MLENLSSSQFWLIIGIAMMVVELFSLSFFAFFLGMGGLLTALLAYLGILPSLTGQVVVFSISSIVFLLSLRKFLKEKIWKSKEEKSYTEFVGDKVKVVKDIPVEGRGSIFYRGAVWEAISEDGTAIEKDSIVSIVRMDGIIAIVRK